MWRIIFFLVLGYIPLHYLNYVVLKGDAPFLPSFGIVMCIALSSFGTSKGYQAIGRYMIGASIKTPRVGTRALLGIVICEANFFFCLVMSNLLLSKIENVKSYGGQFILFTAGFIAGACSYCSSLASGIICAAITMMDAKDPTLFYKLVFLEVIPAGIGILGLVLGLVLSDKAA
ncbi:putative vacuolar ATP synthase proteolipid [Encephalitozoon romaleae SJ-2008]|uniref:Vacuolar ATP synthase proteolipid n=1 Tax=Encephalitozoon romaleae (strain SJ-2008) TaxID=1178016 RepID=I7AEK5_ENCRO|nr:putative vacuolar ATP synthase proteolipid [Encephalitozoon romaleae SJ-2008]AFN83105.1 putative vacuolar ATP synthase proteolipid [Encephalitozoon romaleae SJ-2008]